MSYQDPYNAYNAGHHTHAGTYQDSQDFYNPYNQHYTDGQPENQNSEPVYNQYPPPQRAPTSASRSGMRRVNSGFEGEFPSTMVPPDSKNRFSARDLKDYRYGHQGNLCTKGGRVRCIGRICCCSLMTAVFLIVSIVLAFALWIRPPSITIGSVQLPSESSIQTTNNGITFNLSVDISVSNPNSFSVDLTKLEAELFYPINNTPVGGGSMSNIVFQSRSQTSFLFPFELSYNSTSQQDAILKDLATKCGVGGTKSNLDINYKISLGIRILIVTIFPVISNTFSFPCPIPASDISQLVNGLSS